MTLLLNKNELFVNIYQMDDNYGHFYEQFVQKYIDMCKKINYIIYDFNKTLWGRGTTLYDINKLRRNEDT